MVTGKFSTNTCFHKVWRRKVLRVVNGLKSLAAYYALCRELGWLYDASRDVHECLCNVGSKSGEW
jgi:hypothetical protein